MKIPFISCSNPAYSSNIFSVWNLDSSQPISQAMPCTARAGEEDLALRGRLQPWWGPRGGRRGAAAGAAGVAGWLLHRGQGAGSGAEPWSGDGEDGEWGGVGGDVAQVVWTLGMEKSPEATVLAKDPQAECWNKWFSEFSRIHSGQTWTNMSIIGNTQEDVRRLRQPSSCGWDGSWSLGEVPLQRASLRRLHRKEVTGTREWLRIINYSSKSQLYNWDILRLICRICSLNMAQQEFSACRESAHDFLVISKS